MLKLIIHIHRKATPFIVGAVVPMTVALGSPTNDVSSQNEEYMRAHAETKARIQNSRGQILPPERSSTVDDEFMISWIDAGRIFSLQMGETKLGRVSSPYVIQTRELKSAGSRPDETLIQRNLKVFDLNSSNGVRLSQPTAKYLLIDRGSGEKLRKRLDTKYPDFNIKTEKRADGVSVLALTQLGPAPRGADGSRILELVTTWTQWPIERGDVTYKGFSSKLKKHADRFTKQHQQVMETKRDLEQCLIQSSNDQCALLKKQYASKVSARETLWNSLLKTADMNPPKAPAPPPGSCERCVVHSSCGPSWQCFQGCCEPRHGPGAPICYNDIDCGPIGKCVDGKCE